MRKMILLYSHLLTDIQKREAELDLGIKSFISLPQRLQSIWSQIPAQLNSIIPLLVNIQKWLLEVSEKGDYVLIQGDYGASFIMVNFAIENELIPVYATSKRIAIEKQEKEGKVKITHVISHERFRRYELRL